MITVAGLGDLMDSVLSHQIRVAGGKPGGNGKEPRFPLLILVTEVVISLEVEWGCVQNPPFVPHQGCINSVGSPLRPCSGRL